MSDHQGPTSRLAVSSASLQDVQVASAKSTHRDPFLGMAEEGTDVDSQQVRPQPFLKRLRKSLWWPTVGLLLLACVLLLRPLRTGVERLVVSCFDSRLTIDRLNLHPPQALFEVGGLGWHEQQCEADVGVHARTSWVQLAWQEARQARLRFPRVLLNDARFYLLRPNPPTSRRGVLGCSSATSQALEPRSRSADAIGSSGGWASLLQTRFGVLEWEMVRSRFRSLQSVDSEFDALDKRIQNWEQQSVEIAQRVDEIQRLTRESDNPLRFEQELLPMVQELETLDMEQRRLQKSFASLQKIIESESRRMRDLQRRDRSEYRAWVAERDSDELAQAVGQQIMQRLLRDYWRHHQSYLELADRLTRSWSQVAQGPGRWVRHAEFHTPQIAIDEFEARGEFVFDQWPCKELLTTNASPSDRRVEPSKRFQASSVELRGSTATRLAADGTQSAIGQWRYAFDTPQRRLKVMASNRPHAPWVNDLQLSADPPAFEKSAESKIQPHRAPMLAMRQADEWLGSELVLATEPGRIEGVLTMAANRLRVLALADPELRVYVPGEPSAVRGVATAPRGVSAAGESQPLPAGVSARQGERKCHDAPQAGADSERFSAFVRADVAGSWGLARFEVIDGRPEWLQASVQRIIQEELDRLAQRTDEGLEQRYASRIARLDELSRWATEVARLLTGERAPAIEQTLVEVKDKARQQDDTEFARRKADIRLR